MGVKKRERGQTQPWRPGCNALWRLEALLLPFSLMCLQLFLPEHIPFLFLLASPLCCVFMHNNDFFLLNLGRVIISD